MIKKKSLTAPLSIATGVMAVGTFGLHTSSVSAATVLPVAVDETAESTQVVNIEEISAAKTAVAEAEQASQTSTTVATSKEAIYTQALQEVVSATQKLDEASAILEKATPAEMEQTQSSIDGLKKELELQQGNQTIAAKELDTAKEVEKVSSDNFTKLQSEYDQTNSNLSVAKTNVNSLLNQVSEAQAAVVNSEKAVESIGNEIVAAEQTLQLAKETLEAAKQTDAQTFKQLEQAQEELTIAKQNQIVAETDLTTKTSAVRQLEENVKKAKEAVVAAEKYLKDSEQSSQVTTVQIGGLDIDSIMPGNVVVGYSGTFYEPNRDAILSRINMIRKEAFDEGLVDRYVPMKWSTVLEQMTHIRAAEAETLYAHVRWNGEAFYTVGKNNSENVSVWAENLAWNSVDSGGSILRAIEQFYNEKSDYVNNTPGAVVGHYVSLINPNYTHTAMSAFLRDGATTTDWKAIAQLFGTGAISEELVGQYGKTEQLLEVKPEYLTQYELLTPEVTVAAGEDVLLNVSAIFDNQRVVSVYTGLPWSSDNGQIAEISDGMLTGISTGTTTVYVTLPNGSKKAVAVTVVDIQGARAELNQAKDNLSKQELALSQAKTDQRSAQVALDATKSTVMDKQAVYNQLLAVTSKVSTAQMAVDSATKAVDVARQQETILTQNVALAKNQLFVKEQALSIAQTELATRTSDYDSIKNALTNAEKTMSTLRQVTVNKEQALKLIEIELLKIENRLKEAETYLSSLINASDDYRIAHDRLAKAKVAATIALEQRDEALKEKENAIIILNAAIVRYNRLKAIYDAQVTLQNVENEQLNFKKETTLQTTILNSQVPISTTKENNKTVLSTSALPKTGYNHSVLSLVGLTTLGVLHSSIQRRRKRNKK